MDYTPISNPTLPPIDGYVEVEIDDVRQYQQIQTPQDAFIALLQQQIADLQAQNSILSSTIDTILTVILPSLMA